MRSRSIAKRASAISSKLGSWTTRPSSSAARSRQRRGLHRRGVLGGEQQQVPRARHAQHREVGEALTHGAHQRAGERVIERAGQVQAEHPSRSQVALRLDEELARGEVERHRLADVGVAVDVVPGGVRGDEETPRVGDLDAHRGALAKGEQAARDLRHGGIDLDVGHRQPGEGARQVRADAPGAETEAEEAPDLRPHQPGRGRAPRIAQRRRAGREITPPCRTPSE